MDNGAQREGDGWRSVDQPRSERLPPTAWCASRSSAEDEYGVELGQRVDTRHTIAELIALVREAGLMVGGHGLWDPRHEDEVRRMLTTALELEGVLPPGSVGSCGNEPHKARRAR
jgi:hypothetical protein